MGILEATINTVVVLAVTAVTSEDGWEDIVAPQVAPQGGGTQVVGRGDDYGLYHTGVLIGQRAGPSFHLCSDWLL